MAVTHLPVAVPDAPGGALPYHLPAIGADLEAVTVVPRLILVPHETQEGHVHWCHPKLEGLKVQAEVLPETVKHLLKTYQTNASKRVDLKCIYKVTLLVVLRTTLYEG